MLIKNSVDKRRKTSDERRVTAWGIAFLFTLCTIGLHAQTIWENHRSDIYPYLYRMAQKGLIDFQDIVQPVSRLQIANALDSLQAKKIQLSSIEQKELVFYLQEFKSIEGSEKAKISLLKKDANQRLRGLFFHHKDFQLNADPYGSIMQVSGTGKNFTQVSNGIQFWGQAKKFAFQFSYRDFTETGTGIDSFRKESPETGIIKLYNSSVTSQNFSEIKTNLSYTWNNGSLSIGKDHLLWGYGESGRIVLSDKAPTAPYIRFDYRPFKWLQFNYAHSWLNSNIIDSNASYNTGISGSPRINYIPKYLVTHSILITPKKGLQIALGESIVYSDQLDIGFFIPINLFKIYDNNRSNYEIKAGSNGQYFLQVSSRNHLKNTHFYSSLFIDEIRVSQIFNRSKRRNQLGYTVGASVTDALLHYLTLGAEYTRINPFVYSNLIPAQFYTQYDLALGDWMGNNADRISLFAKYTPLPRLKINARFQSIRKGGAGSIEQQYLAEPQPGFLFDYQKSRTDLFLQANYELINNFYITGSYQYLKQSLSSGMKNTNTTVQLGFSYGLK